MQPHLQPSEAFKYLHQTDRRNRIFSSINQPLTAQQLSRRTGLSFDICQDVIPQLAAYGLLRCLNENARRGRLYWLTKLGESFQSGFLEQLGKKPLEHCVPDLDWKLYGWVCFNHRSAIIRVLTEPMQPATIKRKARARDPTLHMSANNVRNVIQLFLAQAIVQPVRVRKKTHLRYELTELGKRFQELLWRVEAFA